MIESIASVITPAIAIALSPIPIVVIVLVLVSPRGRVNGPLFALGWLTGSTLLAGAVALLAAGADVAEDGTTADAGADVVQVLLGILFLVLAVRTWRKRPPPGVAAPVPAIFDKVAELGPLGALAAGAGLVVANVKNLPLAISSGLAIAEHDELTGGGAALAALAFGLLATSSIFAAVAYALVTGERGRAPLDALKRWLLANNATILMVLLLVLGAHLVSTGLSGGG